MIELTNVTKRLIRRVGYDLISHAKKAYPQDFTANHIAIADRVKPRTMTSPERLYAMIEAVRYVTRRGIPGDIVECGVWRGGSMMAAALTLKMLGSSERNLYLFDTFEGMPKPTDPDVRFNGESASPKFEEERTDNESSDWCRATLKDVRSGMESTEYPLSQTHFIKGMVERTIPHAAPKVISLLRLDTDFYESTRHELEHLYPRIAHGGVLILDDYGHWCGAKQAVDEYFEREPVFLSRIDHTGRLAIKP
jgi:hypothetical protein